MAEMERQPAFLPVRSYLSGAPSDAAGPSAHHCDDIKVMDSIPLGSTIPIIK